MDGRSCEDQNQKSEEAEDRPQGCPTLTPADAGKQLSANLGTRSGESGSAPTVVASTSLGADAHADHESTASVGDERGLSLEEKAIQRTGANTARETRVGSLGQSTPARVVGAAGPHESHDRGTNCSRRAGSQETSGGGAADDASWRGAADGPRLCVDHRNSDAVSTWQADRHLRGDDSV